MADIDNNLEQIRTAIYGKDVRESIASGIEAINIEVENTTEKQEDLESTFDQLIINSGNSNAEIVDARVNTKTNTTYLKLKDRLDSEHEDLSNKMGILTDLQTENNADLVSAINEVVSSPTKDLLNKQRLTSTVFKSAVDFNSNYFRIPFMCTTKHGTIIAGSDVRYNGSNDFGKIDIAISRSVDGGLTWSNKQIVIRNNNINTSYSRAMDSTIIYDEINDKIYLFANKFDDDISWMDKTDKTNWDVVYITSNDDGLTWSTETSIKSVINTFADRIIFLGGVGSGIVMTDGTIVLPIQVSSVSSNYNSQSGIMYSINNGLTWYMSQSLVPEDSSECNVVEYETGKLLLNARSDSGGKRALYYTTDMGATWIPTNSNSSDSLSKLVQLNGCMGSTIKVKLSNGKEKILYSAPHNLVDNYIEGRSNISVLCSENNGERWDMISSVYAGITDGYSCMTYYNNALYIVLEINGDIIFKDISYIIPLIEKDNKVWNLNKTNITSIIQLDNIISNSDFSNDTTSWYANDSTFSVVSGEAVIKATKQGGHMSHNGISVIIGHKYYVKAKIKSTSNKVRLTFHNGIAYHSGSGNYEDISLIYSPTVATTTVSILDERTTGWDNCYVDYFVLIDLTESYGVGFEPTLEAMNGIMANLSNKWFKSKALVSIISE